MFILKEQLRVSSLYTTIFEFYPQDVLWSIKVNGHEVDAPGLPLSAAHHEGRSVDLAPFLHSGINQLEFQMEVFWGEAALQTCVSPWDKYSLALLVLMTVAMAGTAAFFGSILRIEISRPEMLLLGAGFCIRYIYLQGTPYFVRAYDYWGHADYLNYVARQLSLPGPHANWESYQPPLYYLLLGGATKLLLVCGMPVEQSSALWQGFSLFCSIGVLLAGLWISRLLYKKETNRLYLLAVLIVTPALVFNASRVSNDVLLNLLEFIWLGFLLQFWRQPDDRTWLGLCVVLALALLTKASALALIPISVLCLTLAPHYTARAKFFAILSLIVVSFAVAGWYYLPRAFHETGVNTYIVGNLHTLNPKSHIDGIFARSLVFNPFKVIRYPFVQPWGPRHEYFLEYFFKSIFVGEWFLGTAYRWVARFFVLTALLLVPVFLRGVWSALGDEKENCSSATPLLIVLGIVFSMHWAFLQIAPYMSSQDFRYSVILLVPMVYFFLQGAASLPLRWERSFHFALQLLMLNGAIYLLELALEG